MIINQGLPIDFGQVPDVRGFLGDERFGLSPGYKPPASANVKACIQAEWLEFVQHVKAELESTSAMHSGRKFFSLLHDMCTFASKDTCLGYSAAYIDSDWNYTILALGLIPHNESHSASYVATSLATDFQMKFDMSMPSCVASIRSDGASAALKVATYFELEADICAMHCGDLAMQYACGIKHSPTQPFHSGAELMAKHSAIAAHFSRSSKDWSEFKKISQALGCPGLQFQLRQNTRIGSTQHMLLTNLMNRAALEVFFAKHPKLSDDLSLTKTEWQATCEFEGSLKS